MLTNRVGETRRFIKDKNSGLLYFGENFIIKERWEHKRRTKGWIRFLRWATKIRA